MFNSSKLTRPVVSTSFWHMFDVLVKVKCACRFGKNQSEHEKQNDSVPMHVRPLSASSESELAGDNFRNTQLLQIRTFHRSEGPHIRNITRPDVQLEPIVSEKAPSMSGSAHWNVATIRCFLLVPIFRCTDAVYNKRSIPSFRSSYCALPSF